MKHPLSLLLFVLLMCTNAFAQLTPPCPVPPCLPTGPGLPIDGALPYLFIAGVAYGYKKLRNKK